MVMASCMNWNQLVVETLKNNIGSEMTTRGILEYIERVGWRKDGVISNVSVAVNFLAARNKILRKEAPGGKIVYSISRELENIPEKELNRFGDIEYKDILNVIASSGPSTSPDISKALSCAPQRISQKLMKLQRDGAIEYKINELGKREYTLCERSGIVNHPMETMGCDAIEQHTVIEKTETKEAQDLKIRISQLQSRGICLKEIQIVCYDALGPLVESSKEMKLMSELGDLKKSGYIIVDEYDKMKSEIDDLKQQLADKTIKDVADRVRMDRMQLNKKRV